MNIGEARSSARPRSRLGHLHHLGGYLRPYLRQIAGATLALTIAAGSVLSLGVGLRYLIDNGFGDGNTAVLDRVLAGLVIIVLVMAAATYGRFMLVSWIGERVVADIRRDVYDRVIGLSPGFFETTRTGEVLSRLTTDTTLLQVVIGSSASVALRNLLLLIGGTVMLFVTSVWLTALVFVLVPLVVLPIIIFGRRVRRLSRAAQDRIADVGAQVEESFNAIRTVQAYTHEGHERRRFADRVEAAFGVAIDRVHARALLTALVMTSVFGAVAVVFWVGGREVILGGLSGGELSQFVFFAVVVAGAVGAVSEVYGDLQRAAGATERLLELLAVEPDVAVPTDPEPLPAPAEGALAFKDVTFHYPSRPDSASLSGINLTVAPGERVALVGPSGAGKTTVFQLLLRFYDPLAGSVTLDGVDVERTDPRALRERFALVAQEPVIFSGDAWDNIRYGRSEASDEEVRAAARAAAAEDFLDALPEGFSTFLGERGVRLSGGERQRIAIARAILRDPAVLLLDEATSALDSESERQVQVALERLMEARTTLVIAHRLATVQSVDRIVVLDQGQIVGIGSHERLMAEGGLYARLAALQLSESDPISAAEALP